MSTQHKTRCAIQAGLLGIALLLVAGSALAVENYTCSMGGRRTAAVLTVYEDPVTRDRTCTRAPAIPNASAAHGTPSCHSMARRVDCRILN